MKQGRDLQRGALLLLPREALKEVLQREAKVSRKASKGKEKGKPKGGKAPAAGVDRGQAKACLDPARVASAGQPAEPFPEDCVALGSWANMWMTHERDRPADYFQDELHLAYGTCPCHRGITDGGIPCVHVPWCSSAESIDLFPEGYLWERGCQIQRGSKLSITTPKGRT